MLSYEELLDKITIKDIINIMVNMGSDTPKTDNNGNLLFTTICHGGKKHKLHFFKDSKFFKCYTSCGSMSLYDVLMNVNNWDFSQAFKFLARYKKINIYKRNIGLQLRKYDVDDELKFLNKHLYNSNKQKISLPKYNPHILNIFSDYYPSDWEQEGIHEDVLKYFNVKFYFNQLKAVIPHYDIDGNLVGIKGRNFLKAEIDLGRKYIPITIQKLTYRYPTQFNLYGLYQNQETIKKYKTAILFESEKSVYKYASYYGQENNIALATQGMNVTLFQRDLLLSIGINDVVIAFDKQYLIDYIDDKYKETEEYKEYIMYLKSLIKVVNLFINYCNVYIILCWDDRIQYKDSPIDNGKNVFEELYKERYLVKSIDEIKEMII